MSTFVATEFAQHLDRWEGHLRKVLGENSYRCDRIDSIEGMLGNCRAVSPYALTAGERSYIGQLRLDFSRCTRPKLERLLHTVTEMQARAFSMTRDHLTVGELDIATELEEMDEKQRHLKDCVAAVTALCSNVSAATSSVADSRETCDRLIEALSSSLNDDGASSPNPSIATAAYLKEAVRNWIVPRQVHAIAVREVARETEVHGALEPLQEKLRALNRQIQDEEAELIKEKALVSSLLQDVATLESAFDSLEVAKVEALHTLRQQFSDNVGTIESQAAAALLLVDHETRDCECARDELRRSITAAQSRALEEFHRHPLHERIRSIRDDLLRPAIRQLKADVETRYLQDEPQMVSVPSGGGLVNDIPTSLYLSRNVAASDEQRLIVGMDAKHSLVLVSTHDPSVIQTCHSSNPRFEIKGDGFCIDLNCTILSN